MLQALRKVQHTPIPGIHDACVGEKCWISKSQMGKGTQRGIHPCPRSQPKRELGLKPRFHSQSLGCYQMPYTVPRTPMPFLSGPPSPFSPNPEIPDRSLASSSDPGFWAPSPFLKFYSSIRWKREGQGMGVPGSCLLPLPCPAPRPQLTHPPEWRKAPELLGEMSSLFTEAGSGSC